MKYIAHRGLMLGPDKFQENRPEHIQETFNQGYDVEIDVWKINEQWYLGHDVPEYPIDFQSFIIENKHRLWLHTKNEDSFYALYKYRKRLNYFWHKVDIFTLTSFGYPWVYPGERVDKTGIWVMPEDSVDVGTERDYSIIRNKECYAICSDYPGLIKAIKEGTIK
jgi:hypothetical protein